ncbi:ATP-binding protein [Lentisphaera profundi]|uniref:histidine kinase n=1 Tax=Lentisphaera profundi TaxID=1658616 RepID=A0ABY7VXU5_9BACT|nr:ATP-binding protein [Lentisphaera profundi]WDE98542.1 ATP-binding protein [Lentisphaera profundi]
MKISFYTTMLVLSCMCVGFTAVGIVFFRGELIHVQQQKLQLLQQDKVQTDEALIFINQWKRTLDLYLMKHEPYLHKSLKEQVNAIKYINQQYVGSDNIRLVSARIEQVMHLCSKKMSTDAEWKILSIASGKLTLDLEGSVQALQKKLRTQINEKRLYISSLQKQFSLTVYVCPTLFIAFSLIMLKWANRTVVQPIKDLTELARKGEISQEKFSYKKPVEVDHLVDSLNEYIRELIEVKDQAWQEMRQNEYANARMSNIMETAADAIICTSSSGDIIQMNASFRRLTFLTDDYPGELRCEFFLPNFRLSDYSEDIMETFVSVEQTVLKNTNGEDIPIELSVSHFTYEEVMYFTLVIRDIRERERMQQQILQAQKMESVGTLAAGIAHEINTPTQYIRNYCIFLQDAFNDLAKYVKMTQEHPTSQVLKKLEEDIELDFLMEEIPKALKGSEEGLGKVSVIVKSMKVMSHPSKSEKVSYDINTLLKEAVILSRNQWKQFAEIKYILDENIHEVMCYPGLLSQTFINIIVNAAQAIEEQIKTQTFETLGVITIRTTMKKRNVMIKISDTGIGVKDSIRTKIFDPFFTTKEVGVGTGQGLALSHDLIVGKHGGSISFDSNPGLGCSFIILLPYTLS